MLATRTARHQITAGQPVPVERRVCDERGFTLIELLVAMSMGLVISLALFSILQFSTRQTARVTDITQANQLGRGAMTRIVDELHSACISPSFTPILENSGEKAKSGVSDLWFITAYSKEAVIPHAEKHDIQWNEKTEKLIDYTYKSTNENWPNFTYSETASPVGGVLLASGIKKSEPGGKTVPIFQFYSYTTTSHSGTEAGLSTLSTEPLAEPLTSSTAPTAASVLIRFKAGPTENTTSLGRLGSNTSVELSNQITLSFSVPKSEAAAAAAPCQ